jgi:hypothetical protein
MTTRHAFIDQAIRQHQRGQLSHLELVGRLAEIVTEYPCECMACTD